MINTLQMFDDATHHGFSELQATFLIEMIEGIENRQDIKNSSYERDIGQIKNDIIEIKTTLKMMDKMFYALGAIILSGFSLMAYLIKG